MSGYARTARTARTIWNGDLEGGSGQVEALDADAQFAHVLHGGRAVLATEPLAADEEDFLGLPGLLTAEQTAALLSQRDEDIRRRTALHAVAAPSDDAPETPTTSEASWRAAADLRREVNRLVAQVASRSGEPHAKVHVALCRAVPGPASASASQELLERRRDHLLAQL